MLETAIIVAAIAAETALAWWQGKKQEALLAGIYVMLAQQGAPAPLPQMQAVHAGARPPNGHWRRGWPSVLSGRLVGFAEQPLEEKQHHIEHE